MAVAVTMGDWRDSWLRRVTDDIARLTSQRQDAVKRVFAVYVALGAAYKFLLLDQYTYILQRGQVSITVAIGVVGLYWALVSPFTCIGLQMPKGATSKYPSKEFLLNNGQTLLFQFMLSSALILLMLWGNMDGDVRNGLLSLSNGTIVSIWGLVVFLDGTWLVFAWRGMGAGWKIAFCVIRFMVYTLLFALSHPADASLLIFKDRLVLWFPIFAILALANLAVVPHTTVELQRAWKRLLALRGSLLENEITEAQAASEWTDIQGLYQVSATRKGPK